MWCRLWRCNSLLFGMSAISKRKNCPSWWFRWKRIWHRNFTLWKLLKGPSWPWSYGSWIYNYLCNQCPSPLHDVVNFRMSIRARCTALCDKVCQWLATGRWFSPGPPVSSTNKNWRPRYNWHIVESGVKYHQTNKHWFMIEYI